MSPGLITRSGDILARAASATARRRDAARAADRYVLVHSLAVMLVATSVLAANASELWPHLFAP